MPWQTKRQGTNDQGTNDQGTNDQGTNDQDTNDQVANDQDANEQGTNEQGTNEQDAKEQGANEQDANEQGTKGPGRGCAGVPLYCTLYLKIFSQIFQSMQKFKGVVDHRHKGVTQRLKAQGTDQCVKRSIYTTPYNLFFIFIIFPIDRFFKTWYNVST